MSAAILQAGAESSIEMTRSCAADLTRQINSTSEDLAGMLKRAHDEKAWQALGYDDWNSYVKTEIKLSSRRVFQLLDFEEIKGQVNRGSLPPIENERVTRELKQVEPEQRPAVYAAAVEAAGGQQPTAKQVESAASLFTMPKELKAILAANEPIAFFHLKKSGELVPATNGRWFIWWTQLDADGVVGNLAGNKKADSAERVWEWFLEMDAGNNRVAWEFIEEENPVFSTESDPVPWKYNHALFTSYDEHLEHVLGIRKGRK
jgi:hypothetical protein